MAVSPPAAQRGIIVDVLGDTNPFSRTGRSSCYRVTVRSHSYLLDCGAPVFQLLSFPELAEIRAIVGTHSHDDHRRWLGDLALYRYYVFPQSGRLKLLSTERILEEYEETSRAALELSLNPHSDRVVDVPYETFFEPIALGPAARYRIVQTRPTTDQPSGDWQVIDTTTGEPASPSVAKIVFNPTVARPRLLVRDPREEVWVEPDTFYAFGDDRFYLDEKRAWVDEEAQVTIEVIKDHSWHGLPTVGVRITTDDEVFVFSSDTVYNPDLWQRMTDERLTPSRGGMDAKTFEKARVVSGDINDFIERVWSDERLEAALDAYRGAVVLQDTASLNSVVHTDYPQVRKLATASGAKRIVCVHAPDRFASLEWLSTIDKRLHIVGDEVFEQIEGRDYRPIGDVYLKEAGHYYVGFKRKKGKPDARFEVIDKKNQLLDVIPVDTPPGERPEGKSLFHCALYEDIDGRLYPRLTDAGESYRIRADGLVEHVRTTPTGSLGTLVTPLDRTPVVWPKEQQDDEGGTRADPSKSSSSESARKRARGKKGKGKKDSDTGVRFRQPQS